jgi:hypothetical protein
MLLRLLSFDKFADSAGCSRHGIADIVQIISANQTERQERIQPKSLGQRVRGRRTVHGPTQGQNRRENGDRFSPIS